MICALPLGLVYCGHPDTPAAIDDAQAGDSGDAAAGQDRRAERVTAFRRNLGARVEAGEITRSQAEAEMVALLARMAAVGEQAEACIGDAVGAAEGAAESAAEGAAEGARRYEVVVQQVEQRLQRLRMRMEEAAVRGRAPDGNR